MQQKNRYARQEDVRASVGTIERARQQTPQSHTPTPPLSRLTLVLASLYFLLFALFGLLAFVVHTHPVLAIDVKITTELQEYRASWLRMLMLLVSYPGAYPLFMPVLILLTGLLFWIVRLRLEAIMILAVSLASKLCTLELKVLVDRPRPTANLVAILQPASGKSFPSEHVMLYVAFWGFLLALTLLFRLKRWWHYPLLLVSGLFVTLVGPARVYLGDHWASDVAGSYLLSGLLLSASLWIYLRAKKRRKPSSQMGK